MTDGDLADRLDHLQSTVDHIDARVTALEARPRQPLLALLRQNWFVVAGLLGASPAVAVVFAAGIWSMKGDEWTARARDELGVTQLQDQISLSIAQIQDQIERLSGARDIIYQPPGRTYVREPVHVGGELELVFVARRTAYGEQHCTYQNVVIPSFIDERNIAATGTFQGRGRQYTQEAEATTMRIEMPPGLEPGRVLLTLQIHYDCQGDFRAVTTYPVTFELLPDAGPSP